MEVSFNGHKVQDNAQLSVADVRIPPVIKFAAVPGEQYLFIIFSSNNQGKYIYWATTSTAQIIEYQAPVNQGMYSILCIVLHTANKISELTRTNLNAFKISDFGTIKHMLRFYISGFPGLPSQLKTNIAYQNLDLPSTLSFCEVNPTVCNDEYWRYAAKKFLTDDLKIIASLTREQIIDYLNRLNSRTVKNLPVITDFGFEKLLDYSGIDQNKLKTSIPFIFGTAADRNFPYLIRKIIDLYPEETGEDIQENFNRAAVRGNIDSMTALIQYLTPEQINSSLLEVASAIGLEVVKFFLDTGIITNESIRSVFGQTLSVPVTQYLLEQRPALMQDLGHKYEMMAEYIPSIYVNKLSKMLEYLNTLPIPQASVDIALGLYTPEYNLMKEVLKKGPSQIAKNEALQVAIDSEDNRRINLLRQYGAM